MDYRKLERRMRHDKTYRAEVKRWLEERTFLYSARAWEAYGHKEMRPFPKP